MNVKLIIKYINYFNNNWSIVLTMLVYNSFWDYLEKSIKEKFYNSNIDLAVILDSLISNKYMLTI